uniref:Uncharacterized protein n=1 Tax=Octopus bimaculoides TaxID=37653 RepID=A0A0L8HSS2_OCTBM
MSLLSLKPTLINCIPAMTIPIFQAYLVRPCCLRYSFSFQYNSPDAASIKFFMLNTFHAKPTETNAVQVIRTCFRIMNYLN